MRDSGNRQNFLAVIVMALLLAVAVPATSFGKDHGHGRGRDKQGRKCGKFVNCHDARNGRWDRRSLARGWNDDRFGRRRVRQWDRNDNNWIYNNRIRNRDFNGDNSWRNRQHQFTRGSDFNRDNSWRNRQRKISRNN